MKPVVLVTGASGFAGSHVMEALLGAGYAVRVLVRHTSDLRWIPRDQVEMITADVRDPPSLHRLVEGVSWIFHFAGVTRAPSAEALFRVNAQGTQRLAKAFLGAAPQEGLFLFCSSLAASGPAPSLDQPRRESDPPQPISAYGESKLAAERWLAENLAPRMRLVVVRPPAIYGPRDEAVLSLFRWAERGWLPLPSRRHSRVSLIHARDLAEGCLVLAAGDRTGTFHLGDGVLHSWEEVGQALGRTLDRRLRTIRIPPWVVYLAGEAGQLVGKISGRMPVINRSKVRDILQPYWICDEDKVRRAGYTSGIELDAGIRETALWYRSEGWLG